MVKCTASAADWQHGRCILPKVVYTVKKCSWRWASLSPETFWANLKRLINENVVASCLLFTLLNVSLLMVLILWHLHYILAATVCPVGRNYFSSLLCERMITVILHFRRLIVQHVPFHFCYTYRIRHIRHWVSTEPAFFCRATWHVEWGCHGLLQLGNEHRHSLLT